MILIDTEIMRQLVFACSAANDSINEAVDVLERLTTHNDWGCKERDSINEYTNQNKIRIRALQEKSRNFLEALTLVSHDFENAESSISDMFSSLEALLGGAIAIPIIGEYVNTGTWNDGTWPPQAPSNFRNIFYDFFSNNTLENGPGYQVFHYDEDGNLLYAARSTPLSLEKYEVNNLTAIPMVCNFSDLSFDGGEH